MKSKKTFEYEITRHSAESFHQLAYFCSETGECSLEEIPADQALILQDLLNQRGQQGWELIQMAFGKDGILAFWKRKIKKEREGEHTP